MVWTSREARFVEEEQQAYRDLAEGLPAEGTPNHDLMIPKEACAELRSSRRNT